MTFNTQMRNPNKYMVKTMVVVINNSTYTVSNKHTFEINMSCVQLCLLSLTFIYWFTQESFHITQKEQYIYILKSLK